MEKNIVFINFVMKIKKDWLVNWSEVTRFGSIVTSGKKYFPNTTKKQVINFIKWNLHQIHGNKSYKFIIND